MTYSEAIESVLMIEYLKIDAQDYTDSLGNKVYIQGVEILTTSLFRELSIWATQKPLKGLYWN
jgi:hypothetical protein